MDDPNVFRKDLRWYLTERATRYTPLPKSSKPLALAILLTLLFGTMIFIIKPTGVVVFSTGAAILSTILIFFAALIAAYHRD
jgi:hypothetical protein